MSKKDKLLNASFATILMGFAVIIIRKFIFWEVLYSLNDYFWIISATLLILAISKYKIFAIIPLIVGIMDEILQYKNMYPDFLDKVYTSTADINDIIAYVLGFITALIIYKYISKEKNEQFTE